MLFLGLKSIFGPLDHMIAFTFTSMLLMFFTMGSEVFEASEMLFPILTMLTRSMIIAIRYAFMSDTRYSVMKSNQTFDFLKQDLLVFSWHKLQLEVLNFEIQATRYRIKYEEEDYYFDFLTVLDEDLHYKLSYSNYYSERNLKMSDIVKINKLNIKEQKRVKVKAHPIENAPKKPIELFPMKNKEKLNKKENKSCLTLHELG